MSRSRLKTWAMLAASAAAVTGAAMVVPSVSASSPPPAASSPAARTAASDVLPFSLTAMHALRAAPASAAGAVPVTVPLPPSQCLAEFGTTCYDGRLLRHIYGADAASLAGADGRGVTVELVLPFKNPELRYDLGVYSAQAGLPPADLSTVSVGDPPVADPADPGQTAAVEEGVLDATVIHALAPRARILYVQVQPGMFADPASFGQITTLVARLQGTFAKASVWSVSYGYVEQNYADQAGSPAAGAAMIRSQDTPIDAAIARTGLTVVTADGDTGPTGPDLAGDALYTAPTVAAPLAGDPLVTTVSGTLVTADDTGNRTAPDTVWSAAGPGAPATGGGVSAVYPRPGYQDPYSTITGGMRGLGDISMIASEMSPVWIYTARYQAAPGQAPGWTRIAGTSVAAPAFAALVALADQEAGRALGAIDPALYRLAAGDPAVTGLARVTAGCNTAFGVTGFCANSGPYSLPDGNGTIGSAAQFVPALASLRGRQ